MKIIHLVFGFTPPPFIILSNSYMPSSYRGRCACCGASYHSNKFRNNSQGFYIPSSITPIDLKYFSVENNRVCASCKKSLYCTKNTVKEIFYDNSNTTVAIPNDLNSFTKPIDRKCININLDQNINTEAKKSNEVQYESEMEIIFGLKPSCYVCNKCDIELQIITVGRNGSDSSPFGQWYCLPCLSYIGKRWIPPRKRKLIDYSISSERTQQRRRKELRETVNSLAVSETSVSALVDSTFEVNKLEDKILSENISNSMEIIKKNFSPEEYKSIACLLTDKIPLDRAFQLTGIEKSCISRYRTLKNKNKIFEELNKKRSNEYYQTVLNAWGDVNVTVISGKSQKRMPEKCWKENYLNFCKFYKNYSEQENIPSFDWFRKQAISRRWLRSLYDRYRCCICYLGKEAKKLKDQQNKRDEDMMAVLDKNGSENEKKIGDVLKEEEEHIKIVRSITKVWKEIYSSIPIGTVIFCHDNSTIHESNSTKVRWCNISMRYRTDNDTIRTLKFDYLTKHKNSTLLVLLAWNLFLRHDAHYIPPGTQKIWIYSDSHERNNMHIYVMDMIQRILKVNVSYISLPPHHGHNISDGHFAHGKQKLRATAVNSGVKGFEQVVSVIQQVATKVRVINYEQELGKPAKKIVGILKYFGFVFIGDGKARLYDQNLKFDEQPQKVVNLDETYRIRIDQYLY